MDASSRRLRPTRPPGFTLTELLMVIVVIAMLAALLLPAIGMAVKKAKEAAVQSEINIMAQGLESFRTTYGDYPPSRILLCEDGNYGRYLVGANAYTLATANATDISDAALAARSLTAMRKFFPRLALSSSTTIYTTTTGWPDFNGNGTLDKPAVLSGDECLTFFLGGVPQKVIVGQGAGKVVWSMTGLGKDPRNPFPSAGTDNRNRPFFDFRSDRLVDIEGDGYPSYCDSLSTNRPFAYFSSHGGTFYDPNDCNYDTGAAIQGDSLVESDGAGVSPITLKFTVPFPVKGGPPNLAVSPPPNPYTSTPTTGAGKVIWQKPQTYQILSAGVDGLYGLGGMFDPNGGTTLPLDSASPAPYNTTDTMIRVRENDNLTSFHNSRLD